MDKILLKNASLINEEAQIIPNSNILISQGRIEKISSSKIEEDMVSQIIDCSHLFITPGLVNLHTHSPMNIFKGIHLHVSDAQEQIKKSRDAYGQTPFEVLVDTGVMDQPLMRGHDVLTFKSGKLKEGYNADLLFWNLDNICTIPVYNPLASIIYSSSAENIIHSMIGGKFVKEAGVTVYHSEGNFTSSHSYKINEGTLQAKQIIVATGSEPACLKGSTFSKRIISHKEALILKSVPDNLLIMGGDVEGIEFASMFSQLGTKVTILEQLPQILPGYDRDLVEPVKRELFNNGVTVLCSTEVQLLDESESQVRIVTNRDEIICELVLITGLRKNSLPSGLKELGVKIENDCIEVDGNLETSLPGIFAVGDINGLLGMAGAAVQQAVQLGDYLISGQQISLDYSQLPRAVFSIPQISGAGLQEKEISKNYTVKKILMNRSWREMHQHSRTDFVKIISDKDDVIRGIWFVGKNVEVYGTSAGLILKNKMTINDLRRDLYIHPTNFESVFEATIL